MTIYPSNNNIARRFEFAAKITYSFNFTSLSFLFFFLLLLFCFYFPSSISMLDDRTGFPKWGFSNDDNPVFFFFTFFLYKVEINVVVTEKEREKKILVF